MGSEDWSDSALIPAAGALAVATIAALAYAEVLGYWFTGTDTIPLIQTSRVGSVADAAALFGEPLLAGTPFADNARFYRPLVSLSFALDFALWGLDPFGYHLTNVLLHAGTASLVFLLARELGDGDDLAGALAGIVFGLHPLTVEVIPSPARRQDVLATAFVVLSVLLFVRSLRRERRDLLVAAAGAYLLALGSKETAIVLPVIVAVWFLLQEARGRIDLESFLRRSVTYGAPFAIVTVGYFAVRLSVLGGMGGYVGRHGRNSVVNLAIRYVRSLVYPVDHLYIQSGIGVQLVPNGILVIAAVCAILVVAAVRRRGTGVLRSDRARRLYCLGVWAVAPFLLIAYTGRYALRSGYLSLVPIGVAVGLLLAPSLRTLLAGRRPRFDGGPALGATLLAVLLATSLLAGSPLVRSFDGWDHAGDVTRQSIEEIESHADSFPRGANVTLSGVPHSRSATEVTDLPRARSVTYMWGHTATAWFRLREPQRDLSFSVNDTTVVTDRRVDVRSTVHTRSEDRVVEFEYEPVRRSGR